MSRQFQPQQSKLRLGLDVPAVVSLLLALSVAGPSVLSPASKTVLSEQMLRTVAASADVKNEIYGTLGPVLEASAISQKTGVASLNTTNLDLNTMDMTAFGDVE